MPKKFVLKSGETMKIFLDTANLVGIKKWVETGLIDGITTNPTLLSKEDSDPKKQILELCSLLPHGDVSVEVTEQDPEAVYKQAKEIAKLAKNVVVKIPCHKQYYAVIRRLVDEGVAINVTLVFTLIQGMLMAKLGVKYISPFIGRWDDIDIEGVVLLHDLRAMLDQYGLPSKIIAASLRHVRHVHHVINAGADVATVPVDVLEKMTEHPLTDRGMEIFNQDWQKLDITTFP
jgi:transaldolase